MHRLIMKASGDDVIDHINGDVTDNRRCNLRKVTMAQNVWNRSIRRDSRVGIKGVRYSKKGEIWEAYVCQNYRVHYVGCSKDKEVAGRLYDVAAILLFGEYARLNFPGDVEGSFRVVREIKKPSFWQRFSQEFLEHRTNSNTASDQKDQPAA
jgi:AP2 domain.